MPHCGSRTATGVECMPAGWPRPAPNTLEVLYGEIECNGTQGHGPALVVSSKRYYFEKETSLRKTATFARQPPTLSSLANDVGGQPLAGCGKREKTSWKQRLQYLQHTYNLYTQHFKSYKVRCLNTYATLCSGIALREKFEELSFGFALREKSEELSFGIVLREKFEELSFALREKFEELSFGIAEVQILQMRFFNAEVQVLHMRFKV